MKLSEFMTCWRVCVPAEFSIDLEQLKVINYFISRFLVKIIFINFRDLLLSRKILFLTLILINLVKKLMNGKQKHQKCEF